MRNKTKNKNINKRETIRYDIIDKYIQYENMISCLKKTKSSEVVISEIKQRHDNFLILREALSHELTADIKIGIEVHKNNCDLFSTWIESSEFPNCHLMRFDTKGGAHKLTSPEVPLKDQMIETPHFHKFEKDGTFQVYRTKDCSFINNLDLGFPYFCQISNTTSPNGNIPNVKIICGGELKFQDQNNDDPNENISFA